MLRLFTRDYPITITGLHDAIALLPCQMAFSPLWMLQQLGCEQNAVIHVSVDLIIMYERIRVRKG